ncbi:uncharacterized protein MELLADRAFT_113272 [Melampsora larici-populina 98AG31]|uniref:Uncharacterized protein n=1 Tax=Melampsora larici-populina (strain 98AG31 / pathotype 3-4-7) TaxID=747676 RepID=F4S9B6_MELLP|nr:uncharacterized protein MELLADRAFT_113272 [Melampsora larici-populina 98AG31]EGF98793.1 hypothetical protein MELLADRAFT_113272 [Melampsora larici-populina 98AG31]
MSMADRISAVNANLRQTRGSLASLGVQPGPGLEEQKRRKKSGAAEDRIAERDESGGGVQLNEEGGEGAGDQQTGSGDQQTGPINHQTGGGNQQGRPEEQGDRTESDDKSWRPGADKGKGPGGDESEEDELSEGGSASLAEGDHLLMTQAQIDELYTSGDPDNANKAAALLACFMDSLVEKTQRSASRQLTSQPPKRRQQHQRENTGMRRRSPSPYNLIQENLTELSAEPEDTGRYQAGKRLRPPSPIAYENAKKTTEGWLPDDEYREKKAAERRNRSKRDYDRNNRRGRRSPERLNDRRDDWKERQASPNRGNNHGYETKRSNHYGKRS